MTIEDQLKDCILRRYASIRDFCITHDIPVSTIHSILKRGVNNSSVTNVIKICKALEISVDSLADGEIKPVSDKSALLLNSRIEFNDLLDETRELLSYNGTVTLDGNPIDKNEIESLIDAIEVGVEIAKRKNKT